MIQMGENFKMLNRKNALVIGANEEAIFSIETAHRLGFHVDALDGNAEAKGMPRADAAHHVDINDLEEVFRITDPIQPCVVVPAPIGHCLTTVGAVNDRYHLAGVTQSAAEKCTDKFRFHEELAGRGLRNAQMLLLREGQEVIEEDLEPITQFPVVVKPRYGSGSRGVEICGCADELRCLLQYELPRTLPEDYVVETCIPGPEYGVDGAYVNGEFRMVLLRRKKNTPPPYRQCVGYYSILPEEEPIFYANCCRLMQEMGETLGFENCIVHADIIRRRLAAGENSRAVTEQLSENVAERIENVEEESTLTDEPFVIETSARPSGHNLSNLFTPLASGVTLVEDFLKLALNGPGEELFRPEKIRKLLIRYFDLKPGVVEAVPEREQLMENYPLLAYSCALQPGDELCEVRDGASVMGRGYYILEAESETELDALDEKLRSEFRVR